MNPNRRQFIKIASVSVLSTMVGTILGMPIPKTTPTPAFFVGHGSPMNAIQTNRFTEGWKEAGKLFPTPRAILVISAHWQSRGGTFITANPNPPIIYDMSGFPKKLYDVKYPALGDHDYALKINTLLKTSIYPTTKWGLDHGTWSVLVHMYPKANIPILQLSMNTNLSTEENFALGQELAVLRKQGVMIIGSGNIVHNLRLRRAGAKAFDWAEEFDHKITKSIDERNFSAAVDYQNLGELATLAHPSNEHYLPLLYLLGLIQPKDNISWFNEGFTKGCLGMRSLMIT